MDTTLLQSLQNSFTYSEYRALVTARYEAGKVTGHEQSEALLHYTQLNQARMHRLDKTTTLTETTLEKIQQLDKDYLWVVLTEGWCGDAAQIVPVLHKMAEASNRIELRFVLRDDNPNLMDQYLTNGTRSIPKLIVVAKATGTVVGHFGPRPQGAKQLILDYKNTHGVVDETAKTELQKWYLQDKGVQIQEEVLALLQ